MTQILNDDHGRGPVLLGDRSVMKTFLMLGIMEAMKSPCGNVVLGVDLARPDETVHGRGQQPSFVHLDEYPFYLREEDKPPSGVICQDEQGPWPPIPNVDHCNPGGGKLRMMTKPELARIKKAAAKRARKNKKRLNDGQVKMVKP